MPNTCSSPNKTSISTTLHSQAQIIFSYAQGCDQKPPLMYKTSSSGKSLRYLICMESWDLPTQQTYWKLQIKHCAAELSIGGCKLSFNKDSPSYSIYRCMHHEQVCNFEHSHSVSIKLHTNLYDNSLVKISDSSFKDHRTFIFSV